MVVEGGRGHRGCGGGSSSRREKVQGVATVMVLCTPRALCPRSPLTAPPTTLGELDAGERVYQQDPRYKSRPVKR